MRTAILGLIAASALGCAAVNDGRLETAVDNAEPITLVRGQEYAPVTGTIETPGGICDGQAEPTLFPEGMHIMCGDYTFVHSEFERGGLDTEQLNSRFFYTTAGDDARVVSWRWDPDCSRFAFVNRPYELDSQGRSRMLQEAWIEYSCGGTAAFFTSTLFVDEGGSGRFHRDNNSPLTFDRDATEEDNQRYQSILSQMNVQEAERLWREWRHTALGYEQ